MRSVKRGLLTLVGLSALSLAFASATALGTTPLASAATTSTPAVVHSCPTTPTSGHFACLVLKRTDAHPQFTNQAAPNAIPSGVGYGPSQLQSAYNIVSQAASAGGGKTIALVDAFDYGNAQSDLNTYRSAAGLSATTLTKVNQNGAASPLPAAPPANDDWTLEEALDLDMASAICPNCHLALVEAQDRKSVV